MDTSSDARLLRIFISSTDKYNHVPLYEMVVMEARRFGLSGATVLKGIMGFGASSSISSSKFFELSEKLPMVVEIVDNAENIEKFTAIIIPFFDKAKKGCMITVEKVNIILYKKGGK
jgi:PII-like signaling protein